jgi:putative ABC transport system permease protein
MIRLMLHNLWANKRRLVGIATSVVIGVGFLAGTLMLGDTLRANFDKLFSLGTEGIDVVIRPEPPEESLQSNLGLQSQFLDASLAKEIRAIDEVRITAAVVQGFAQILGADGERVGGEGPPTFSQNWVEDEGLNPYNLIEGRGPEGTNEVVIDEGAALEGKLEVGDTVNVLMPELQSFELVGIARFGDSPIEGGVTYAFLSEEGAAKFIPIPAGKALSVVAAAKEGVSQEELLGKIKPLVPPGAEALTGVDSAKEQSSDINEAFLGFLTTFLVVFAGIALFVATFSIYNTFGILVAQRSKESALLRAVGAQRGQVLRATMLESVMIGIGASMLGVLAGIGIATGLKSVFEAFGLGLPTGGLNLKPSSLIWSFVVGVLVTIIAAILPAIRGSRVAPVEAMRSAAVEVPLAGRVRTTFGAFLAASGIGLLIWAVVAHPENQLTLVGVGSVVALLAMLALGPVAAPAATAVLGAAFARFDAVPGSLAFQNSKRNPRRTAATASALMVGVTVVVLFSVFIASLKGIVTAAVDNTFGGDLVVSAGQFGGVPLPAELTSSIQEVDGVESAVPLGSGEMLVEGEGRRFTHSDRAALTGILDLEERGDEIAGLGTEEIAVSNAVAEEQDWKLGDTVDVRFEDDQPLKLKIASMYEHADLVGEVLVGRDLYAQHSALVSDQIVFITIDEGASVDTVAKALKEVSAPFGKPDVRDRESYTESVSGNLDQLLGLITVMLALAILIAVMGIANTLSLSIVERTRELGLLRAVGMTRIQLRRMVLWESILVSLFGVLGGVVLGLGVGWALVETALGDSAQASYVVPVGQLVTVSLAAVVVGVWASRKPSKRASRVPVLSALGEG